jgi:hypothetical protein
MFAFLDHLSTQTQDSISGCGLSGQEDLEEDIDVESLSYQVDIYNLYGEKGFRFFLSPGSVGFLQIV